MKVDRGTVVLVVLDPTVGREQRAVRPCIAVSDAAVNADQRFPIIAVVPLTGTPGQGALYPELSPGKSGLTKSSYALVNQIRSIDKRRIAAVYRSLEPADMEAIDEGIRLFLGLTPAVPEG